MESTSNQKRIGILVMVVAAVMWSTGGFLIKMIPWNPLFIAGMRSLFAALVAFGMLRALKLKPKINKYVVGAALGMAVCLTGYVTANKLTTAANAIMLQYDAPIVILIISALFLHKPLHKKQIIAVALTAIGIVLFFMDGLSPGNMIGNLIAVVSGAGFATFMVCTAEGGEDDATRYSGILFGHLLTALFGLPAALFAPPTEGGLPAWAAIVALGIFQLGIPYVLVGFASKHISALANSMISMLEPILNPIWVALSVGEIPGPFAFVGGIIILATVTWWCLIEAKSDSAGDGHAVEKMHEQK